MAPAPQVNSSSESSHWDDIYQARSADELSWFEDEPATLQLVLAACKSNEDRIVDVGAGASTLVDHLLIRGYVAVTLVDLSGSALAATKERLGELGTTVEMMSVDIRGWRPPEPFDVWHDRATFHFMASPEDRASYRATLAASISDTGRAVIAAFGNDGPDHCAGLPVARYSEQSLAEEFSELLQCTYSRSVRPTEDSSDSRPYVIGSFARRSPV